MMGKSGYSYVDHPPQTLWQNLEHEYGGEFFLNSIQGGGESFYRA